MSTRQLKLSADMFHACRSDYTTFSAPANIHVFIAKETWESMSLEESFFHS